MTATQQAPQTRIARINHWQNRRQIRILPDQVGLQVTVPSCNHCSTCQKRVRQFNETLANKPDVIHQWKYLEGAEWVFFPTKSDESPLQVLKERLQIQIDAE